VKKQPDCKALKQGFSLVELSIVIVIIGLLVGGIMSLQTYVANSKLNTMMNESKIYISAFNQFQTRYNAPPGDYASASSAWSGAGNGDGNGLIRANGGAGNTAEYYYAFQHLALAGFIQGSYTGAANGILRVAGLYANSTTPPSQPFLTPKDAAKIDIKYDDGAPYTGNILAPKTGTLASCTVAATSSYNTGVADAPYCYLILRMQ
jgi:prepilin-type N-terminal cleavage/methylation domain-containing protein